MQCGGNKSSWGPSLLNGLCFMCISILLLKSFKPCWLFISPWLWELRKPGMPLASCTARCRAQQSHQLNLCLSLSYSSCPLGFCLLASFSGRFSHILTEISPKKTLILLQPLGQLSWTGTNSTSIILKNKGGILTWDWHGQICALGRWSLVEEQDWKQWRRLE